MTALGLDRFAANLGISAFWLAVPRKNEPDKKRAGLLGDVPVLGLVSLFLGFLMMWQLASLRLCDTRQSMTKLEAGRLLQSDGGGDVPSLSCILLVSMGRTLQQCEHQEAVWEPSWR